MRRRPAAPARTAASAVEFALVAPFLATLVLGMFEISRGIFVKEALSGAAQKACRTGALPGKSNTDVEGEVSDIMADSGITGYSVTVLVNGAAGDVKDAKRNDKVSVQVSVPVSKVFWTTTLFLKSEMVQSETVVMMRQG